MFCKLLFGLSGLKELQKLWLNAVQLSSVLLGIANEQI